MYVIIGSHFVPLEGKRHKMASNYDVNLPHGIAIVVRLQVIYFRLFHLQIAVFLVHLCNNVFFTALPHFTPFFLSTFHLFSGLLENITSGNNSHFIGHGALEYHVITMPVNI